MCGEVTILQLGGPADGGRMDLNALEGGQRQRRSHQVLQLLHKQGRHNEFSSGPVGSVSELPYGGIPAHKIFEI